MQKRRFTLIPIIFFLAVSGCAQAPREAVELSATVGRDLSQVHESHREIAILLFDRMEGDINRFVDEVYSPFQIRKLLAGEFSDFQSGSAESLFAALDHALKSPSDPAAQAGAVETMDIFVQVVQGAIEDYRSELLSPVRQQSEKILSEIEHSYLQLHYANSIVTGHLASVVKVHDAQEGIFRQLGLENLRQAVGVDLEEASKKISKITMKAPDVEHSLDSAEVRIEKVSEQMKALWKKL